MTKGADSGSFAKYSQRYQRDKNYIYYAGKPLPNIDVNEVKQIGDSDYLIDSDSLYYLNKEIKGIDVDVENFKIVSYVKKVMGIEGILFGIIVYQIIRLSFVTANY